MKIWMALCMTLIVATEAGHTQSINWRSLDDDHRNIVALSPGYDYGATLQFGYGRSLPFIRPVVLGANFTIPMGRDLLDDFKIRLGAQVELVEFSGFAATLRIASIFRRYETPLVRMVSFGSEFALLVGYYRPTWFFAVEGGFDKAITTHMKHADVMRTFFPGIRDGWYVPTGGNFSYGIEGGAAIVRGLELSLRAGATHAQPRDESAVIPLYMQVGITTTF